VNPDQRTERQVEEWLDAEARPMPPHVLESALEAVARTTQVGRKGRFGVPWLNQRFLAVGMAAAVVVLAVIAAPLIAENLDGLFGPQPGGGPDGSPREAQAWNPATDYRLPPNQVNPSPDRYGNPEVWSYVRSTDGDHTPERYFLLPNFHVDTGDWYERDFVNLIVGYSQPDHAMSLHGWSDGNPANNRFAILAWRSPISGAVTLRGAAWSDWPDCGAESADGITFFIERETETLATFHLALGDSHSFNVTTSVEVGETLYFINDPGADARCDTALLRLAITGE
jgi:hypothetical protein